MKKEWYVVNTVSGYEYKVKEKLEMRINSMDLQENIFRVIVPEQKEIEYKNGVKKEISRIKWTSKKDLLKYSVASILFVIFFGVFFYVIDMMVALLRSVM